MTQKQVEDIARTEAGGPEYAANLESAVRTVMGTARNMGIEVEGYGLGRSVWPRKLERTLQGARRRSSRVRTRWTKLGRLKKVHFAKFDETVELVMNLGVDPKHSDQMVRGTVVLPHGLGKSKRVLVIASGEKVREAQEAGADFVGGEDMVQKDPGGLDRFRRRASPRRT